MDTSKPILGRKTPDSINQSSPEQINRPQLAGTTDSFVSQPVSALLPALNLGVFPAEPKNYRQRRTLDLSSGLPARDPAITLLSPTVRLSPNLDYLLGFTASEYNLMSQVTINKVATLGTHRIVALLNELRDRSIRIEFHCQDIRVNLLPWQALMVSAGLHDASELFGRLVAIGVAGSIVQLKKDTRGIKFISSRAVCSALFRCSAKCQSSDPAIVRKEMVENARDIFFYYLCEKSIKDQTFILNEIKTQFETLSLDANEAISKRWTDNPDKNRILYAETAQNFGAFLGLVQQGAWKFASHIEMKDKERRRLASNLASSISVAFGIPTAIAFPPAIAFVPAVMDFAGRTLMESIFTVRSFKEVGAVFEGSMRLQIQGALLENNSDGSIPTTADLLERNFNAEMFINGCDGVRRICGN